MNILAIYSDLHSQSKIIDSNVNVDDKYDVLNYIKNYFQERDICFLDKIFIIKSQDNIPYIYKEYENFNDYFESNYLIEDFFTIEKSSSCISFKDRNFCYHRLNGPAKEYYSGDDFYFIKNILYMKYDKQLNILYLCRDISELPSMYEKYIKRNINYVLQAHDASLNFINIINNIGKDEYFYEKLPLFIRNLIFKF